MKKEVRILILASIILLASFILSLISDNNITGNVFVRSGDTVKFEDLKHYEICPSIPGSELAVITISNPTLETNYYLEINVQAFPPTEARILFLEDPDKFPYLLSLAGTGTYIVREKVFREGEFTPIRDIIATVGLLLDDPRCPTIEDVLPEITPPLTTEQPDTTTQVREYGPSIPIRKNSNSKNQSIAKPINEYVSGGGFYNTLPQLLAALHNKMQQSETPEPEIAECDDNKDNDNDGLHNERDPGCYNEVVDFIKTNTESSTTENDELRQCFKETWEDFDQCIIEQEEGICDGEVCIEPEPRDCNQELNDKLRACMQNTEPETIRCCFHVINDAGGFDWTCQECNGETMECAPGAGINQRRQDPPRLFCLPKKSGILPYQNPCEEFRDQGLSQFCGTRDSSGKIEQFYECCREQEICSDTPIQDITNGRSVCKPIGGDLILPTPTVNPEDYKCPSFLFKKSKMCDPFDGKIWCCPGSISNHGWSICPGKISKPALAWGACGKNGVQAPPPSFDNIGYCYESSCEPSNSKRKGIPAVKK